MATRQERIERQNRDDGDLDDSVYLKVGGRAAVRTYHDEADCPTINGGDVRERTRRGAQRAWKAPCRYCVLGDGGGEA